MAELAQMKYTLSALELAQHLKTQLRFLEVSSLAFDRGEEDEAKRMATHIRVLFHNTRSSRSLISQLNMDRISFLDTAGEIRPDTLFPSLSLVNIVQDTSGSHYRAKLGDTRFQQWVPFQDWWNKVVFASASHKMTRKTLILNMADTDGGAHVDPQLNSEYASLVKKDALGWYEIDPSFDGNMTELDQLMLQRSGNDEQHNQASVHPAIKILHSAEKHAVRQIAYEAVSTIRLHLD